MFYDLYMANRYDRARARRLGVTRALNRLASVYRARDVAERGGRRSWRDPEEVLRGAPWLVTGEGRV